MKWSVRGWLENLLNPKSLKISAELKRQLILLHQIIKCMFYCELRYLFPNSWQLTYDMTQNFYPTHQYEVYFIAPKGLTFISASNTVNKETLMQKS